jgi:hypothetical protein
MSVAFPTGYYPNRAANIRIDTGMAWTPMDDGSLRGTELSVTTYTTVPITIATLTEAEKDTLLAFFDTNKAEDITWTFDGVDYIGNIRGPIGLTMVGNRYNLSFVYHAREA